MKKLLLGALAVGLMFGSTASANNISKEEGPVVPLVQQTKSEKAVVVKDYNKKLKVKKGAQASTKAKIKAQAVLQEERSASAIARTDRKLLTSETPESVRQNLVEPSHSGSSYKMRSGDNVELIVYGHDDISSRSTTGTSGGQPYIVRPDGKLGIPLIGDVYCQNRAVDDVVNEITCRLAEYIIDPKVSINITKLGTTRVYVLGEVRNQGAHELDKSHNLLDAVAKAGGFTQKSAKRRVYVVRRGLDNFVTEVNMLALLRKGNQSCNIELQEGDSVYISSNHKLGFSQVLGMIYSIINAWDSVDDIRKD